MVLLGVIGGTLASALSLSGLGESANTRYSLAVWQAAVKVLFGGAAAVLGILLVRAGFSSVLRLDGQVQILAFAVIFGYSQQLLTRLIDKEATALTSDAHQGFRVLPPSTLNCAARRRRWRRRTGNPCGIAGSVTVAA